MAYRSQQRVAWNWKACVANGLKEERDLQLMQCCITINAFEFPRNWWQGTGERKVLPNSYWRRKCHQIK